MMNEGRYSTVCVNNASNTAMYNTRKVRIMANDEKPKTIDDVRTTYLLVVGGLEYGGACYSTYGTVR